MDTIWFYLFACVPFFVGGFMWLFSKTVVWWEWLAGSLLGFFVAGFFHLIAINGATADVETWSGQIVSGVHTPKWHEYYEYAVYRTEYYNTTETYYVTDSKGRSHARTRTVRKSRQVFDHWQPTTAWHGDTYSLSSNISTRHSVGREMWFDVAKKFGDLSPTPGVRKTGRHNSRMLSGDPNDYVTSNKMGWVQPVTDHRAFENKVKATPTTFSYAEVPKNVKVFPYPKNDDPFRSDRLLGSATLIDALAFDQMNARLGPKKRVNVIMVGFGDRDSSAAHWQEAAWIGGKKNDVVICWGGSNKNPTWVRAFGWTDSKTCLRNIESIILREGATDQILAKIEDELVSGYRLKDWNRAFAHVRVPAPAWAFWFYLGVTIPAQVLFWWWARKNECDKMTPSRPTHQPAYAWR